MIFKLLKYNIKKQRKKYILIPIFLGLILSLSMKNIINNPNSENIFLKDVFLDIYGGLSINLNDNLSLMEIIKFLTPHLIIIYLAEIYFLDLIKSTPRNMFLRIGNIKKWIASINLSLFYVIVKYYIVLYSTSLITMMLYMNNFSLNIFNFSNISLSHNIIVQIMLFSILTIFLVIIICTNLYFFFNKNDKAIIVFILFNITSVLLTGLKEPFNLFLLINHLMIKRHSLFPDGYSSLTLNFSLIYLSSLIILNYILSLTIVKKHDF